MAGTSLLDPNILRNDPALGDVDTGFWDQFGKGLNSSVTGTHAGLRGMSGTVGEMVGADEFAQAEYQRARELQAEAQAQGPRIGSYKDAGGSLRDATSYVGGILGGSAPSMALGMGAGMVARTALGGLVAGTLAQTPLEAADVAMKQLNDPGAMAQPAGERFVRQIGGGAASAGLQTIIPNMVGGKLVGRGAEQAAKQSIKQIAGRNAMSIPAEGFFEGSSEGLKQMASNNENDLNWDQIGENVVGGMVGGAPMAGAGFVGDTAGRVAPQAREAFGSARESINERLSRARGAAGEQIDAAAATAPGKKIRSAYDDIADMVERGKGKFDDTLDKILKGEELGDPGDWLRATTDEAKKRMADFSDNERVKAATQWGKDMLSKLRPDDPRRGPVEAADPNTVDGQMLLASEKKKFDASEDADAKIDALSEALGSDVTDVVDKNEAVQTPAAAPAKPTIAQRKQFIDEAMASGMTQEQARTAFVESMNGPRMDYPVPPEVPKLSADYSGVQKVIADAIKDNGIVSRRPELFDTDRKIEAISRNMRILLEQLPKGPLDETVIKSVTRVFGDDTDSVIDSLKRTLAVDLSPQESENFFGNLRLMKDINEGDKGLHDVMRSSLTDEARTRQQMTEKDAEALIKHARGQMGAERTAEKEHFDRLVDDYYKNNFGDKADTVRAAVEKAAGLVKGKVDYSVANIDDNGALVGASEGGFDEGGSRIEAAAQDKVIYGLSAPDAKGNSKSELGGAAMLEGSRYAKQHELDLKAKFPDKDVYFERLPDSDYGHVVVEDRSNPGEFNAADLAAMKHDTKKYPNSPSRLSVGGHIIDAVKVAKVMRGKLQDRFEGDSPTTAVQRLVDGFKQGIAQLTEQFGEVVNVPDSAVIGFKAGNKPLTWGEAQSIRSNTAEDRMSESGKAKLAALRKEYKGASAKDKAEIMKDVRKLVDFERDRELVGDTDETAGARYAEKMSDTRITNVKGDRKTRFGDWPEPKEIKDERYDQAGNLTKEGAHTLLTGDFDGGLNPNELANRRAGTPTSEGAAPETGENRIRSYERADQGQGRTEVGMDENVHLVAAVKGDKGDAGIGRIANMDGSGQFVSSQSKGNDALDGLANEMLAARSKAAQAIGGRIKTLIATNLTEKDQAKLNSILVGETTGSRKPAAEIAAIVNPMAAKYAAAPAAKPTPRISAEDRIAADNFEGLDTVAKVDDFLKSAYAAWENGSEDRDVQAYLNQMFGEGGYASTDLASFYDGLKGGNAELDHFEILKQLKRTEGSPDPKPQAPKGAASGKKQAFLKRAAEGDKALLEELGASNDAKGLQRALGALNEPVFEGVGGADKADLSVQPDTLASGGRFRMSDKFKQKIANYIEKVLGTDKVTVFFAEPHQLPKNAGAAFAAIQGQTRPAVVLPNVIKSYPEARSFVYHESAHALFHKLLNDPKHRHVVDRVVKVAMSDNVQKQLTKIWRDDPSNSVDNFPTRDHFAAHQEEAVAYMYQHWAEGKLTITDTPVRDWFGRIREFLARFVSHVTDEQYVDGLFHEFKAGTLKNILPELTAADYRDRTGPLSTHRYKERNKAEILATINDRLSELVRDPDVAYGMQTTKYSLEAVAIHRDLGRDGFAATHDSPIKHEGKFDWRKFLGLGEGNSSFGVGTYLSTSDGVHRSYKAQFSGALSEGFGDGRLYDAILQAYENLDPGFTAADVRGYAEEALKEDISGTDDYDDQIIWDALRELKGIPDNALLGTPSPTYEVSVGVRDDQLMDWNGALNEQPQLAGLMQRFYKTAEFQKIVKDLGAQQRNGAAMYQYIGKKWTFAGNKVWVKKAFGNFEPQEFVGVSPTDALNKAIASTLDGEKLYRALAAEFNPNPKTKKEATLAMSKVSELLQAEGILGHKYNASGGKNDVHPNYVIYDDSKITTNYVRFDKAAADPNAINPKTERDAVKAHILKVLGPTVKVAWKNLTTMKHAGDYTHSLKLIRLSVHAINPMSTGYHESLHAFFGQLRDAGATDITKVLEKAASSQLVIDQLKQRYAGQPEVLNQLKDPEERAAYMYQMWASDPTFKVAISAKGVFGRIKAFIQRLAGAWTNDERALHIMEYFHSGEYAKNMGSPSAVRHALMDTHRSQILETAQSFAEPLGRLADAVVGTGGARLRDTGVPALEQLADIFKREHTSEGGDQGFIAASRIEGAKMRTQLGELLSPYTPEHLHDAMEALQSNTPAVSTEAQQAVKDIKKFLRATHNYMTKAGVNIGDLGPDYFPRVWDTHYISKNQQAFRDMLEPYIRSGQMKGSADDLIRSLLAREGAEFGIESREPGMQHKKERLLDFITPQDSAQFVEKNLLATMSSYINQASRKAEWTRRLGGGKLDQLLDEARSQGATTEQLDVAEDYMKGIDGTLGSTGGPFEMTPTARRLMGDMIVYQNIRLLPMAAFSMLIDPMGIMVRGGSVGQAYTTFKRGIAGIKDTFAKDGGQSRADQATKWAELIGVVDSAMMTHAMSDIYSQGMVGGTAKKINNAFFKYNLVEGLNRNFRIGASEAAMKFMTHHAGGLSGKGPSTHSVRWMKELGLQKGDIIVTPAGHLALTEQDGLSAAQVQRVHAAINQWVDGAVLRPDAADKPIWMNDPHYALISHLKQFVFSFQKTILARVAHEFRNGNYTPSMALASYVPIMIAADTAKGLLGNAGDTPEWKKGWTVTDHVGYGVERAGLFGVGQFGLDIAQDLKRGGTGVGSLTGPTIDQLGDMVSTLGGRRQFGTTALDALPANTLLKGWSGKGEAKADPVAES